MIQTLVTGGTGFVGSAIVRQLVAAHETVHVLTRNPSAVPIDKRIPGALYVKGDVQDSASLKKAMQGCDAIIHCVQFPGAPFENPAKGWTYDNIDRRGTEMIAELAKNMGIQRMIYISGAGAGTGRTETWFQAKDRAEKAVKSSTAQWTIFRPSWIYGPQDKSLNRLMQSSMLPLFFPIIGSGMQKIAPLYIDDFAKAVALSLNREKFHKKTIEIGGPEVLTFDQMMHQMLECLGKKKIFLHVPTRIVKFFAEIINTLPVSPFITSDGIDFICMDVDIEVCDTHTLFGFACTDFQIGLQKYL